jgi:hypothetical protein
MNKLLILIISSYLLISCATGPVKVAPTLDIDYVYPVGAKIGYISKIPTNAVHENTSLDHYYNTRLDSITILEGSWKLDEYIYNQLKQEVESNTRYELVNISKDTYLQSLLEADSLAHESEGYRVANENGFNKYLLNLNKYKLDAIIIVNAKNVFWRDESLEQQVKIGKAGAFGFSSFKNNWTYFFSSIGFNTFTLNPKLHYIGWHHLGAIDKSYINPESHREFSKSELMQYKNKYKEIIKQEISKYITTLPKID